MLNGKEFDKRNPDKSTIQNTILGGDIITTGPGFDNNLDRLDMEVLTHGTVNTYDESEITFDDLAADFVGLLIPSGESNVYTELPMHVLEGMVDSLKEINNPGLILQDGDVRISTQDYDTASAEEYIHYFFRDGEFLYSVDISDSVIEYGENYYTILAEMLQGAAGQLPE